MVRWRGAAAALLLLTLTGCGPDANAARPAGVPVITQADEDLLARAEQIMLRDCMARRGFRYQVLPEHPVPDYRQFPYVIDDPAWAARNGFGTALKRRLAKLSAASPNKAYFRQLPRERRAAALAAANGPVPEGLSATAPSGITAHRSDEGCTSEGEREIYGDLQRWFEIGTVTRELPPMWRQRVAADPAFRQAQARWARCLRAAGYPYDTPAELHAALAGDRPGPARSEIPAASAEAACAASSGFGATARELDGRHAAAVRARYREEVEDKARMQYAALPKAREVVRGG